MRGVTTSFFAIALVLLLISGCAKRYHLRDEQASREQALDFAADRFDGQLDIIWEAGFNSKPSGPLSIYGGALAVPSAKRRIEFFDLETGEYLGRVKTKGVVHTEPLYFDSLIVFGVEPPRGRVVCWDLKRHKEVWRYGAADPIGTASYWDGKTLIATRSGTITSLFRQTGEIEWTSDDFSRLSSGPIETKDKVFVGTDDGQVIALNVHDGSEVWNSQPCDCPIVALSYDGDREAIWAVCIDGTVHEFAQDRGLHISTMDMDGGRWSAPKSAGDHVVLASSSGRLVALTDLDFAETGTFAELWSVETGQASRIAPVVAGNRLVTASLRGTVGVYDIWTGAVIEERDLGSAIAQSPVSYGGRIYVATRRGDVVCLGSRQ